MTTSLLIIVTNKKVFLESDISIPKVIIELELSVVLYIYFPVQLTSKLVQALINLRDKVNVINSSFAKKLSIYIWQTKISTQKINISNIKIFRIVIASFLIEYKRRKSQFFEKIFLLANISINIVLKIFFLTLSNMEINFMNWKLNWRLYIIIKAFPTIKWVKLV